MWLEPELRAHGRFLALDYQLLASPKLRKVVLHFLTAARLAARKQQQQAEEDEKGGGDGGKKGGGGK
jgi:hypothetical protein